MSFVIAAPELIESAAHDLSGIGSTLGEATHFAAAPTTSIAAAGTDEISAAIAELFGSHGQQFQALSAQAAAFHDEFVGVMKSGAGAYVSAEVGNAGQLLTSAAGAPANELSGGGGAAAALTHAENAFVGIGQKVGGAAVLSSRPAGLAAEIQTGAQAISRSVGGLNTSGATLFSNTAANLQRLETAILANPHPLLLQIAHNQAGYLQTIGTGFIHSVDNLPADLRAFSSVNPAALVQHFLNNQVGYAHTISTSVGSAAHDFTTGVHGLPASFQTACNDLATGNTSGAVNALGTGLSNLFITGFDVNTVGQAFVVTPTGALGDLLPILAIPGQMAQNFTNLLPANSIAHLMSQNFTNVIKTVLNTSVTSAAEYAGPGPGSSDSGIVLSNTVGLPLVLGIELLGGPANALNALGHSATSFVSAVQTGNALGAATALIDAPAHMANAFLNGHSSLPLTLNVAGLATTVDIPLDGILVPAAPGTGNIWAFGAASEVPIYGTPIGGLVPGLLHFLPEELAAALGGPAPLFPTPPVI